MHFLAILNRDGGTLRTMDLDAFCLEAREIFEKHGHSFSCEAVAGSEVEDALRSGAATDGVDVLLAAGGDGTISTAAEIAFEAGIPLAVLPAGTMNLFARALQLPLDLHDALEALATGELRAVDIATANGVPFVHQFGVGIHARLVRIRENMSYSSRLGKIFASLKAIVSAAMNPPRFDVEVSTPRGKYMRNTSGIAVSNNPIGDGHMPHADQLDRGVLGLYVTAPLTTSELIRLTAGVLSGRWRGSPMVWEKEVTEVTLRFPRRKRSAQAVVDGELIKLEKSVHIRLHHGGLSVIAPRLTESAPAS